MASNQAPQFGDVTKIHASYVHFPHNEIVEHDFVRKRALEFYKNA